MPEYKSLFVANHIKELLRQKKISASKMLAELELNKNTLFTMQSSGYLPRLESVAQIADYLDCSVDYLLGRTEDPQSHKAHSFMDDVMVLDLEQRAMPQIAPDAAKQHTKEND